MHASSSSSAHHALTLCLAVACSGAPPSGAPPGDGGPGADGSTASAADGSAAVAAGGVTVPGVPWLVTEFPMAPAPADNPTTPEKVELGRLLFYDPVVSSDHAVACATCHSEVWGMSDGLARSVGNGAGLLAGPGRDGSNKTRRNAPTLWNVAFRKTIFWDGRAASLEDQVHFPFEAKEELNRDLDAVLSDLRAIPAYVALFRAAFPGQAEPIDRTTFARAIAAFERTTLSDTGLYDAYIAGDRQAMDDGMIRGMALFAEERCTTCHQPPLFESERFADRGVAGLPGIDDAGRFEVTHDEADRNAFDVPTLRNAHDTGPYFHTGAAQTVDEAVGHEVTFSVAHDGARTLSASELGDLTAFIRNGLIDSRRTPTRPRKVPSGLTIPIDGFSIRR